MISDITWAPAIHKGVQWKLDKRDGQISLPTVPHRAIISLDPA
jgi:hypothetical protein